MHRDPFLLVATSTGSFDSPDRAADLFLWLGRAALRGSGEERGKSDIAKSAKSREDDKVGGEPTIGLGGFVCMSGVTSHFPVQERQGRLDDGNDGVESLHTIFLFRSLARMLK